MAPTPSFDFSVLAEEYVGRWLAVLIELAVLLDIIAVGIGFQAAVSRGLFTLAHEGCLPRPLATTNRRQVPQNAQITIFLVTTVVVFIALAKYGTGPLLDPDGSVIFPEEAFSAFLIAFDGRRVHHLHHLRHPLHRRAARCSSSRSRPWGSWPGWWASMIAVLGVAAQFIEGTAPTGRRQVGSHARCDRHHRRAAPGWCSTWRPGPRPSTARASTRSTTPPERSTTPRRGGARSSASRPERVEQRERHRSATSRVPRALLDQPRRRQTEPLELLPALSADQRLRIGRSTSGWNWTASAEASR